jgi:hypothetical protein
MVIPGRHRSSSGSTALLEIADAVMRFDRRLVKVDLAVGVALLFLVVWLMS